MRRYELTISTGYVPNWCYIEGIREIFQNAIDGETRNSDCKMFWEYDAENEVLRIGNKNTYLPINTLLLGESDKRDDAKMIGQHGEGYKIALMVLMRDGKTVRVQNSKEVWTTSLVKSRRFSTKDKEGNKYYPYVPVVEVSKGFKGPTELVFEVGGITPDEFKKLKEVNLNLWERGSYGALPTEEESKKLNIPSYCVLTEKENQGKIFVHGLYVTTFTDLKYGYNLTNSEIKLDRDRDSINNFQLSWVIGVLWKALAKIYFEEYTKMLKDNVKDIQSTGDSYWYGEDMEVVDKIYKNFIAENGENSYPVTTEVEKREAIQMNYHPVIVNSAFKTILMKSENLEKISYSEDKSLAGRFKNWFNYVNTIYTLPEKTVEEFMDLVEEVENMEKEN